MPKRFAALTGRCARAVRIAPVLLLAAIVLPAVAWAVTIEIGGEVFSDKCTPCHADYTETDNPKYIFTHGNHIIYQCSTCHPEFPHQPSGTVLPVMKDCFNCHGLQHGPQGVLATGVCADCHGDKVDVLRPKTHGSDWAEKPHVAPANERLTTECSMCHTKAQCDECHVAQGVVWKPAQAMVYDAQSGCLACHGSPNLVKSTAEGVRSFQVTGLDASAHRDLHCPDCHIDFAYDDVDAPSKVWYVNAGLACASDGCHDKDDPATEQDDDIVTPWRTSVHGQRVADGDVTSATCGSCHGSHDIARLDTDAARRSLQMAGEAMCARCHQEQWINYDDSYHGAAYKAGAEDSPACWDCHPAHEVLASNDPSSTIAPAKLAGTCASCHQHKGATEEFVEQTSEMIHGQAGVRGENPLFDLLSFITGGS